MNAADETEGQQQDQNDGACVQDMADRLEGTTRLRYRHYRCEGQEGPEWKNNSGVRECADSEVCQPCHEPTEPCKPDRPHQGNERLLVGIADTQSRRGPRDEGEPDRD